MGWMTLRWPSMSAQTIKTMTFTQIIAILTPWEYTLLLICDPSLLVGYQKPPSPMRIWDYWAGAHR